MVKVRKMFILKSYGCDNGKGWSKSEFLSKELTVEDIVEKLGFPLESMAAELLDGWDVVVNGTTYYLECHEATYYS